MKKRILTLLALVGGLLVTETAQAERREGNCREYPKSISAGYKSGTIALLREWDDANNEWMDGNTQDQNFWYGVRWYVATLTKGKDYLAVFTSPDYASFDIEPDYDADPAAEASFSFEPFVGEDGKLYYYLRAKDWYEEDPATAKFYFHVSGDYLSYNDAGTSHTTKMNFELREQSIADIAPVGSELSPIPIDLSTDGQCPVTVPKVEDPTECYYATSLEHGEWYIITCTPSDVNNRIYLEWNPDQFWADYETWESTDLQTGAVTLKMTAYGEGVTPGVLMVSADNLAGCTLAWRRVTIGTVGFDKTRYEVADDAGTVSLKVVRSSTDATLRYRWTTVAVSAEVGIDYTPSHGEIRFEAGSPVTEITLKVPLIAGASVADGTRLFAVRLESISEGELEDDEYSPTPSPQVAYVAITPTGHGKPTPDLPSAQDEPPATLLANGSFTGVLDSDPDDFLPTVASATLTRNASGALSASLRLNGETIVLTGSGETLRGRMTVKGKTFDLLFRVELPEGTVADLRVAPGDPARLSGTVFVGDREVALTGNLYREESRLESATLKRMKEKAGRYAQIAQVTSDLLVSSTRAYVTAAVLGDGATTLKGFFADGTAFETTAIAFDCAEGLAVPILFSKGENLLAGTLVLTEMFDDWTNLTRLYNGWSLTVDPNGGAFDGVELTVMNGVFVANEPSVSVQYDRSTGELLLQREGAELRAITFNSNQTAGALGGAGIIRSASGALMDATLTLNWLDPDWREYSDATVEISYAPNGGSGTMAITEAFIGQKFELPPCGFTRSGYNFLGWLSALDGRVHQAGELLNVPPENAVFTAQWEDVRLKEALDCDLQFTSLPESSWQIATTGSVVGPTHVVSAVDGNNGGTAEIRTSVSGAGTLTFYWMMIRRDDLIEGVLPDEFRLEIDGVTVLKLAGADTSSFVRTSTEIAKGGLHAIRWVYVYNEWILLNNPDVAKARLDGVSWEEFDESKVLITLNPGEGATVTPTSFRRTIGDPLGMLPIPTSATKIFDRWTDSSGATVNEDTIVQSEMTLTAKWKYRVTLSPGLGTGAEQQLGDISEDVGQVTLPNCPSGWSYGDYTFDGWMVGGTFVGRPGDTYPLSGNVTLTAAWLDTRFQKALKTNLPVQSEGWEIDTATAGATEGKCLRFEPKVDGQKATVTTSVTGAGTITFRWKFRKTEDMFGDTDDRLVFVVDGVEQAVLNKTADWTTVARDITTSGAHTVQWICYAPSSSFFGPNGAGWLDYIDWEPAGPLVTVIFDANGGNCSERTREVTSGRAIGPLPVPTLAGKNFAGWHLDTAEGTLVDEYYKVPETGATLVAAWKDRPFIVTFAAGGAAGTPPPAEEVFPGTIGWTLPSHGSLVMPDSIFVGWSDGEATYVEGAPYTVVADTTFTAVWKNTFFNGPLDCDELSFSSPKASDWAKVADAKAVGGTCLKAQNALGTQAEVSATAEFSGTVTFNWSLSLGEDLFDGFYADKIEFLVDNVVKTTLDKNSNGWVSSKEIQVTAGQRLTWRFTQHSESEEGLKLSDTIARLDYVVVSLPLSYTVTIAWTDTGVVGADCTIDGEETFRVSESGKGVEVPAGRMMTVVGVADVNNWYYCPDAPQVFSESGRAEIHALRRESWNLPRDVTPADVGFSTEAGKPFATAKYDEIVRAVGWARTYGLTVDQMNKLVFDGGSTGNPLSLASAAYLLNCAPNQDAVNAALKTFRFKSFNPAIPPRPSDFDALGYNGTVKIFTSEKLGAGAVWREGVATGNVGFYKATLVK